MQQCLLFFVAAVYKKLQFSWNYDKPTHECMKQYSRKLGPSRQGWAHSFLCDPSMSSHNDIIGQAMSLVVAHGEDAPIQAAMRAQALLDRGDRAGYALWRRIGSMSNVLLSHAAAADVGVP